MNWIFKIAWKNIWRNPSRSMISMASVFFAVILSTLAGSFKEGIFNNLVKNVVSFYTGYIQIHGKGYWDEQNLDNSFLYDTILINHIEQRNDIMASTPRLETFVLAASEKTTKGCMLIGIHPDKENQTTKIRSKLTQGDYIRSNDAAVLCAAGLAKRLSIRVGDTLYIIGQGYHGATAAGKYFVKGIVRFGSPQLNDQALFLPLLPAMELFSTENRITSYVIQIKEPEQLETITHDLEKKIPDQYEVMHWGDMMPDIKQHIETDSNNMKYVQGILYLLICFGIFGTMIMMMMERKYEMGMLIAIGMKKSILIQLVMIESLIIVMVGCVLGLVSSIPLIYYLSIHPLTMGGATAKAYEEFGFEAIFPTSTNSSIFFEQGITVCIIGLILSLYPVIRIIRLNPVDALKRAK